MSDVDASGPFGWPTPPNWNRARSVLRYGLPLAGALCCAPGFAADQPTAPNASAAGQTSGSPAEIEFWRSVERMGSADAYRAYLDAFPNGAFAALARIALKRSVPDKTIAPAVAERAVSNQPKSVSAAPGPTLRNFTQPATSGAVTFAIGERFSGPAALTVGWLGAKKQLVLPSGEWIVLSAVDWKSDQRSAANAAVSPSLATVAFGKFSSGRLVSLLRFTVSSQVATVTTWTDIDGCDSAEPPPMRKLRSQRNLRDECMSLRVLADPLSATSLAMEETRRSIERLGAVAGGIGVVTTITLGERRRGYWGLSRTDWPGAVFGADSDRVGEWRREASDLSPGRAAYGRALWDWATRYKAHAIEGLQRDFDGPLTPEVSANGNGPTSLSTDDFNPSLAGAN